MEDEAILSLFEQRCETALAETEAKYGRLCFRVADNILHNEQDSEECVNDTWLRAWDAIPPERPRKLSAWLVRVTRNLAITRFRSSRAERRGGDTIPLVLDELAECIPGGSDPQGELEAGEISERINEFLGGLRREERDLFVARCFFAAAPEELSAKTGYSVGKVNSMLHRTRRKLRNYLKEEGLC